ncbi:serine/threonine-protein kinase AtPK1/AtPK6-like isoform X2 [Homarus americanus]|nr:serine/threonine-protein kinase AtPK1/AtPK6-like isoform X2 [Homarus americanus]
MILDRNADRESVAQGRRAVHWAAVGGHVQVLQVLRDRGCNLSALTADGSTVLHLAADYGNLEAVTWLVGEGLDPSVKNTENFTAGELAKAAGHAKIYHYLRITSCVARLARPSSTGAGGSSTQASREVLRAASEGDQTTLARLVGTGASLEVTSQQPGEEGLRPLHLAAWGGYDQMVWMILDQNVDREAVAKGRQVVHWAAVGGHVQVLQVLRDRGCNLTALTADGSTILHLAADYGNLEAVKWLVGEGLDPSVKNQAGCTAKDLAQLAKNSDVVNFLRDKQQLITYKNYTTVKCLGEGSFGEVFLVKDNTAHLVLKVIKLGGLARSLKKVAEQELDLLRDIQHSNIVAYKGGGVEGSCLYLLLEYCDGGDLAERIKQQKERSRSFMECQILAWTLKISSALQYLHQRAILHRDLKPHNIFLTTCNDSVKLGDFGLARVMEGEIYLPRTTVGTPAYMSPEVANGLPYDGKADMWSLGCCLYELATLERGYPYVQVSVPKHYSEGFQGLVTSLLNHDPESRPSASLLVTSTLPALGMSP